MLKKPPGQKEDKDIRLKVTESKREAFRRGAILDRMPLSTWCKGLMERRLREQAAEAATGRTHEGWICPRCGTANAPFAERCTSELCAPGPAPERKHRKKTLRAN